MGIVYKAEDTTLERTVALKFLAQHLLNDEEAKERFLREAKAAAALSHPNICTVYEIAEVDGKTFIAMEFVKGETLEERIASGPLTLKDALDIGRQVADGLEAAHEENIIHRDIKPANVMVDAKSHAKVMDFGLARLTEASRLTKTNTAMGTVAYMSPEHAQGIEVDTRTDIWALGCVLYEMISGQRPFQGQYDQALLYEIVHEEPAALTGLRTGVPVELEFIVNECLAKDRDDRTATAQEVSRKLRTLAEKLKSGHSTILRTAQTVNPAEALPPNAGAASRGHRVVQAFAAMVTVTLLALAYVHFTQAPPEKPVARFSFSPEGVGRPFISPDGKYILYTATTDGESSLWLRAIASEFPRQLERTEGVIRAFWSPDSLSIGFGTTAELKRMSIEGGNPITLCELLSTTGQFAFRNGSWSPDGETIVFASGDRLYEIPARGGQPETLLEEGAVGFEPHFLPAGAMSRALVYTTFISGRAQGMAILNLETGEHQDLGPGDEPVYSQSGHLVYGPEFVSGTGLSALPFSLETLEPTGEAFPIDTGGHWATVSRDGTLAYVDQTGGGSTGIRTLVWRDRAGELLETVGQPQPSVFVPAISPDGQRIAVASAESGNPDIWVHDLIRSTKTRLTFDSAPERMPTWSPSGDKIAYWLQGDEGSSLRSTAADGTGEPVVLVEAAPPLPNPSWSRDGRYLVYQESNTETGYDIRYVEMGTDGDASEPVAFLATPASERAPKLSPDGRFVAYMSNESGRNEIYVRPFPEGSGRRQASVNGGTRPRWSRDGTGLFYVQGNNALMAVSVSTAQGVTLGQPQQLFESPDLRSNNSSPTYDVSADGQRFVTLAPVQDDEEAEATRPSIRIVQNWYEEFRDRQQ